MAHPEVSVIIPAYNAEPYLRATVESCLRQTLPPRDIVVVDDGSTDGTADVCDGMEGPVRVVRVANGGVSAARNHGATLAGGRWLVFLDADDSLLPHGLEALAHAAESANAGTAYGMVLERSAPGELPRLTGFDFAAGDPPLPAQRNFRRCAVITPGSAIVRRDLHDRVGGFVSGYEPMEDRDYWIKCGLLERAAFCDTIVLDKMWRPGSAGSQHARRIYRGLLAWQNLRSWCKDRQIDYSWAGSDADFAREALKEALYGRIHSLLEPLLAQCRRARARDFWYYRAVIRLAVLTVLGRRPAPPEWLPGRSD